MLERAFRDVLPVINEWYRTVLFLPEQASELARQIDALHYVEITFFTLVAVAFFGTTLYAIARYRRRGEPPPRTSSLQVPELVFAYAVVMLGIFSAFWFFSYAQYVAAQSASADATPVYVTGKQWMWQFAYPEGVRTAGVLYLPAGRETRLVITSRDVIHSLYVPALRVKQDAVPGRYTFLAVRPDRPGVYPLFCAELCGTGHSRMIGRLVVLAPEAYAGWVDEQRMLLGGDVEPGGAATDLAELGRRFAAQRGCLNCHTLDGRRHIGPTWAGLFGHPELMQDGSIVLVDPAYITESMMDPLRRIVAGFAPVMPSFQGDITPQETAAIIELMRALQDVPRTDEQVLP